MGAVAVRNRNAPGANQGVQGAMGAGSGRCRNSLGVMETQDQVTRGCKRDALQPIVITP